MATTCGLVNFFSKTRKGAWSP